MPSRSYRRVRLTISVPLLALLWPYVYLTYPAKKGPPPGSTAAPRHDVGQLDVEVNRADELQGKTSRRLLPQLVRSHTGGNSPHQRRPQGMAHTRRHTSFTRKLT